MPDEQASSKYYVSILKNIMAREMLMNRTSITNCWRENQSCKHRKNITPHIGYAASELSLPTKYGVCMLNRCSFNRTVNTVTTQIVHIIHWIFCYCAEVTICNNISMFIYTMYVRMFHTVKYIVLHNSRSVFYKLFYSKM